MNKKNIITLLFSLFALISINGFGSSINAIPTPDNRNSNITTGISQISNETQYIICIEGIFQAYIKTNESNNPPFENFNNSKKNLNLNSRVLSFQFSNSCYTFYCVNRINRIKISPFYIAYHRLII